jgi:hypothetical protein
VPPQTGVLVEGKPLPLRLDYLKRQDGTVIMADELAADAIRAWNGILPILGLSVQDCSTQD